MKINPNDVEVMILAQSACAACHAKGACTMADIKEKMVKAYPSKQTHFVVGQHVMVSMRHELGSKAVIFGYILPFVVMVLTLIGFIYAGFSEGYAGLASLFVLIPYYFLLFLFRKYLERTFVFTICELSPDATEGSETSCL